VVDQDPELVVVLGGDGKDGVGFAEHFVAGGNYCHLFYLGVRHF